MKNIFLILFTACFLTACVRSAQPVAQNSMRIYDETAYTKVKKMLSYDLSKQKIDHIELPSESGVNPFSGFSAKKKAKELYERLSLSFRYENPREGEKYTLTDFVGENAEVEMYAYGFTVEQGAEFMTATILGELDFDSDHVQDYLVSFRITQKAMEYEVNKEKKRVEMPSREYILLIRDVTAPVYKGEILYIHDYIRQSSGIRSEIYKNLKDAKKSLFQETGAVSFEQGQSNIIAPPKEEKENQKKESNIKALSE